MKNILLLMSNILTNEDLKKIDQINLILKKYPNNLNLLMQKAYIYFQAYDDDNTIKIYNEIIKLYPNYIDAYFWLSFYLYRVPLKINEAIQVANDGLKINPYRGDLYAVIAWSIGLYEDKQKFYNIIKKSIDLEPNWLSTRISLIEFLIENKKIAEANLEINNAKNFLNFDFPICNDQTYYEEHVTWRTGDFAKITLENFSKKLEF